MARLQELRARQGTVLGTQDDNGFSDFRQDWRLDSIVGRGY